MNRFLLPLNILIFIFTAQIALAEAPVVWSGSYAKSLAAGGFQQKDGKLLGVCLSDPSGGGGLAANEGSVCQYDAGATGTVFVKDGAANTDWANILTGNSGWSLTGNAGTGGTGKLGTTDAQNFDIIAGNSTVATVVESYKGISAAPTIIPITATGVNQFDWRTYVSPTSSTVSASHANFYSSLIWDNPNAGFNNTSGSLIASNNSFAMNGTGTINYASTNTNTAGFNGVGVTDQFKGVTSENQIASGATVTNYYGMATGLTTTGGILGTHTGLSQYSNFINTTFSAQSSGVTNSDLFSGTSTLAQGVTGFNSYLQFDDTTTIANQIQGFSSGITLNDDIVANGLVGSNVNVQINDNAAAGGINLNAISLGQQGASTATGVNGYNANMQFAGTSSATGVNIVNLYAKTSDTADLDSLIMINSNSEIEGSSTVDNITGLSMTPQIRGASVSQNITGGDFSPQMSGTAAADNFTGLNVQPQVNGTATLTNAITGMRVQPQSVVALNGATGVDINMSSLVMDSAFLAAGGQKTGLTVNDGALSVGYNYTVPGASSFFQTHYLGGSAIVASGDPTSAFGFGNNFAHTVNFQDDWGIDASGLGFVDVGFVGAISGATGKTMARWTGALGGAGNPSGDGTLTDAIMFRAAGILPQGGALTVTNSYGFQLDPSLACLTGINCWGFYEDTAAAENHFSKLAIGTSTHKVANSSTALEIGNSKSFLNGRGTTATKNALTALAGMQFYDTDLNELQVYNGTAWVSAGGAGPTFTTGSVPFASAGGTLTESNSRFFYDETNNRLGIGTTTPSSSLTIKNVTDSINEGVAIEGQGAGVNVRWIHYVSPGGAYSLYHPFQTNYGFSVDPTGRFAASNGLATQTNSGALTARGNAGRDADNIIVALATAAQSGDAYSYYLSDFTTKPFSVNSTGKTFVTGFKDVSLTTGVGHLDADGDLTSSQVVNADMANMADGTIKSNISGGSAAPSDNTMTAILDDAFGNTQGDILFRGAAGWEVLPADSSGYVLTTNGAGTDPTWEPSGGGGGFSPSEIYLQGVGGTPYGSPGNKRPRFNSTPVKSVGTDITYTDSSSDGTILTINTTGEYCVNYTSAFSGSAADMGLTLNNTQTTTNIGSVTATDVMVLSTSAASAISATAQTCSSFTSGDTISPQTDGATISSASRSVSLRITRVN